MSAILA